MVKNIFRERKEQIFLSDFLFICLKKMVNSIDYMNLGIFLFYFIVLALLFFFISYGLNYFVDLRRKEYFYDQILAYECGFHSFENYTNYFDVKFYLVAILFLVFDLEVIFLFPWSVCVNLNVFGYFVVLFFFMILVFGFCYEWVVGGLDWSSD